MTGITIKNLTPHPITFVGVDGGADLTIAPEPTPARLSTEVVTIGDVNGIPVTETRFGDVTGLPEPQDGVVYVTSALVAKAAAGRDDVFVTSDAVRDAQGRVVGCRALGRI